MFARLSAAAGALALAQVLMPAPALGAAPPGLQAAYQAAMEGRKADALAAAQELAADPAQYAVLVRFGLWDELIALGRPDPRAADLTAGFLYGRAVALAARGRVAEARGLLTELEELTRTHPQLADVVAVAAPIVTARIAATELNSAAAIAALRQAVGAEDRLAGGEPEAWFFPTRDLLGAQLLIAGRARDAERVYREDLTRHPGSGWALRGLAAAQTAAGESRAAATTTREFSAAWNHADVRLQSSAFWFAGADTTSCECQRFP